jgi:hypothetical protein
VEPHDEESCCGECLTPLMDEAFEKAGTYFGFVESKERDLLKGGYIFQRLKT